jgi:catechol 2,3-dioxygenase-like lactoylglutathione lyase family enzyme
MTVTERAPVDSSTTPLWSGINHLALITPDMDATVRFYHGVLGAELVSTVGTPGFRHYFFNFGPQCTVAFFEYKGLELETFALGAGDPDKRKVQFDHLSLNLPDEDALLGLRERLIAHDCEVTEVVDHGSVRSVYFTDPSGIALEASWWVNDVTAGDPDYADAGPFGDADPVPALRELMETGTLSPGSGTRLS